jgi:hypothetical protein
MKKKKKKQKKRWRRIISKALQSVKVFEPCKWRG